jgi:hypothetical protein
MRYLRLILGIFTDDLASVFFPLRILGSSQGKWNLKTILWMLEEFMLNDFSYLDFFFLLQALGLIEIFTYTFMCKNLYYYLLNPLHRFLPWYILDPKCPPKAHVLKTCTTGWWWKL